MTVQRGICTVDIVIFGQIWHKVVGDEVEQLVAFDYKVIIAYPLVRVGDIVAIIKADKYHRCSFAVFHYLSQFRTVAETPYSVCQEEHRIGLVLVVIGWECHMNNKWSTKFFIVKIYLVNGILYCV